MIYRLEFHYFFFSGSTVLKHRKVKHYGYEFIYGKNNINKNKCLDAKIPDVCYPHLKKLVLNGYISRIPDQLTVNHYLPGQGMYNFYLFIYYRRYVVYCNMFLPQEQTLLFYYYYLSTVFAFVQCTFFFF